MSPINTLKKKFTYKKQKKDNMYNPNTIYAKKYNIYKHN